MRLSLAATGVFLCLLAWPAASLNASLPVPAGSAASLDESRLQLEDAADNAVLARTLFGRVGIEELTAGQTAEMLTAARNLLERQKVRLERGQALVEAGVAARLSLTPLIEELDLRRRSVDLAESRARLFQQLSEMARAEVDAEDEDAPTAPTVERFQGRGTVSPMELIAVEKAFARQFGKSLPVSARGATRLHRSMGFDHRGRMDVALNPDQPEGAWLRKHLSSAQIPYYAFRGAVPGKATGAHIHIGPPSPRVRLAD